MNSTQELVAGTAGALVFSLLARMVYKFCKHRRQQVPPMTLPVTQPIQQDNPLPSAPPAAFYETPTLPVSYSSYVPQTFPIAPHIYQSSQNPYVVYTPPQQVYHPYPSSTARHI